MVKFFFIYIYMYVCILKIKKLILWGLQKGLSAAKLEVSFIVFSFPRVLNCLCTEQGQRLGIQP